jgi:hypothetical protein
MAKLRVEPFENVGYPAILLNTDREGLRIFVSAVERTYASGEATFELDGVTHRVLLQEDAADVELGPQTVTWRFDAGALHEIINFTTYMLENSRPSHQYIDLDSPVEELVISVDEYKHPLSYGEFAQVYPTSTFQSSTD